MKSFQLALAWAAVLIFFPLVTKTGWIDAAGVAALTPSLTVLAVVHLAARGRKCRVQPR